MKHELRYANTEGWLAPIYDADPEFAEGLEKIYDAICMADDIADRQAHPDLAYQTVWLALIGMDLMLTRPSYWPKIRGALFEILQAEKEGLKFIPGQKEVEEDLDLCFEKAALVDLFFQALCCVDPSVDTIGNREWILKFKGYCVVSGDCEDILNGSFEDLRNCRRNYVVLKYYREEFYFHWKHNKEELKRKAKEIQAELKIDAPLDERLKFFIGEANDGPKES